MTGIDWGSLGLGALAGGVGAALFFAGLALGMRLALRSARPTPILLLSGALRIGALLAFGALVANIGGATALAGFALAFVLVRFAVIAVARPSAKPEAGQWS
ncbi:ATP synthase subunit AtpR [Phaeovulum sp.]|uniref:ATP synthase subunit AtpR n=1 Tax=Phaeovulum sp. TaxID=2934796 RepID=UPI0039E6E906